MDVFTYKGISEGKYVEGEIEALNQDEASHKLKEQKIIITNLVRSKKKKGTSLLKLGKKKIYINNVLLLEINNKGLLAKKKFFNIKDMNEIEFVDDETEITYSKRSFVYDFLSSMRQKINDPLGVRKKKRKQIKSQQ